MPPQIFNKRGNELDLSVMNPVLGSGEMCLEIDTNRIKFGDGSTPWNSLDYAIIADSGTIINYPSISGGSGNFNSLMVNDISVSVSGHSHISSNITDFSEAVDDRIASLLIAGTGINLSYNDNSNILTINTSGVSLEGHTHNILELGSFTDVILDAYEIIDTSNAQNESILYGVGRDRYIWQINPADLNYYPVYNTGLTGNVNGLSYDASQNTLFFVENLNGINTLYYLRNNITFASVANLSALDPQITDVTGAAYYNNAIWFFINNTNILVKVNITYTSNIPSVSSIVKYTIVGTPSPNQFGDIAINSSGILYAATSTSTGGVLYSLNLTGDPSNTLVNIGSIPAQGLQISFDLTNNILYGYRNLNKQFYTVSTIDASLTAISLVVDIDFTDLAGPSDIIYQPESVRFYQRRGYKTTLESLNPILGEGELCLEIDTHRIKFGDGSTPWNSLDYSILPTGTSGDFLTYDPVDNYWIPANFSSSVSGLLPVTNVLGGTNISVVPSGSVYTVSVSGSLGLTTEEVDDRVSNLLVAGSGISLDYNDGSDTLTIHNTSISPDEIEEYIAYTNLPASGNINILYRTTDDGRLYQWSGSVYAEIGPDSVTTGSHASQHYTNGIDPILNVVSRPATLTATVNNYAHNNADIIYLNADANRIITGLAAAADGSVKLLINSSLYTITLDHQDTNSNPENRFMVPFGSDYILQPGYSITVVYDSDALRWRVLA